MYISVLPKIRIGNHIRSNGMIKTIPPPSNPGQFNQRDYYKEKNIYYTFQCNSIDIISSKYDIFSDLLEKFKSNISSVYQLCLPQKEYGTINAMILGDKSILDTDIKKLYQINGISHILAISALHITIICMSLYNLLIFLNIPRPVVSVISISVLILYGSMTGFSISTSRAVIMMILSILSFLIGRSYDSISAAAVSAVIILIQKPFSIMSCSFLLSFGSVLGIILIYPKLLLVIYGGEEGIRHHKRAVQRMKKEKSDNNLLDFLKKLSHNIKFTVCEMFLVSISVQLSTLPVILYFFYEYPPYGVFLNLLVIPLASLLVILAVLGGITGLLFMPAARFILGGAYYLLKLYELLCNAANKLPYHIIVTGRPSPIQIAVYYIILILLLVIIHENSDNTHVIIKNRIYISLSAALSFVILFYTYHYKGLFITFLDVGQGDCIFIRSPSGHTYMIDGGSTDTKSVGEYRILPFLRYYGINHVDNMIVTHPDEDHVSGLIEILGQSDSGDINVKTLVLPNPADSCKDTSYNNLITLADKSHVNIAYINTGDNLGDKYTNFECLNPSVNFISDSANAYSTVLSMTYGNTSYLFTGDVENEGEDALYNKLMEKTATGYDNIPEKYDILKIAHHGSKNSSSNELLQRISPSLSVISCGKNNRYGHPHKELIERLENAGINYLRTDENGAIMIFSDGRQINIRKFIDNMQPKNRQ